LLFKKDKIKLFFTLKNLIIFLFRTSLKGENKNFRIFVTKVSSPIVFSEPISSPSSISIGSSTPSSISIDSDSPSSILIDSDSLSSIRIGSSDFSVVMGSAALIIFLEKEKK
jgi:hypothetical protein